MLTLSVIDLKSRVGQVLGESQPHQITQEKINEFADATGDHQWLHVDVERAKQGPYHGTIAHGYLTVSMLPAMLEECASFTGVKAVVNYGLNKLRFPAPVPSGNTVRGTLTVNAVDDAHGGTLVALGFDIRVENADKPAAVGEALFLLYQ